MPDGADGLSHLRQVVDERHRFHLGAGRHHLRDGAVAELDHRLDHVALGVVKLAFFGGVLDDAQQFLLDLLGAVFAGLPREPADDLVDAALQRAERRGERVCKADDRGPRIDSLLRGVAGDCRRDERAEDPKNEGRGDYGDRNFDPRRNQRAAILTDPVHDRDHEHQVAQDAREPEAGGVALDVAEDLVGPVLGPPTLADGRDLFEQGPRTVAKGLSQRGQHQTPGEGDNCNQDPKLARHTC